MTNGNGKFSGWLSSGLVSTVAWFLMLGVYVAFRAKGIEDPLLGQAFLLLTGAWVGTLTLAQGKKQARVEDKVERLEVKAGIAEHRADVSEVRADDSEDRETEWSQHLDHSQDNGKGTGHDHE